MNVLDAHTITVSWHAPYSQQNGLIRMYFVNVTDADSELTTQHRANANTSITIHELVPYTAYFFRVAAVTVAAGPYSEIAYGATPEAGKCYVSVSRCVE